jgi:tRNA pseudouridine38-40 synthase
MRYAILLSYDGSPFCGWQVQQGAETVQECLERALSTLTGAPVSVTGAGRTDSGVNAVGYVAHFDVPDAGEAGAGDAGMRGAPDPAVLSYKLNAILPPSVVVHALWPVGADFHARFDASQRKYTYFLHRLKDPFVEKYSLRRDWDLDFEAMNRAAALLLGRHDFACFEKTGTDVKTTVCTVTEAFWAPYTPTHVALMGFAPAAPAPGANPTSWRYMYFKISADRFLRNMVRAIVGTLLEVGRGKRSVEDFAALILPAGDAGAWAGTAGKRESLRSLAGDSVPGHALFLSGVEY